MANRQHRGPCVDRLRPSRTDENKPAGRGRIPPPHGLPVDHRTIHKPGTRTRRIQKWRSATLGRVDQAAGKSLFLGAAPGRVDYAARKTSRRVTRPVPGGAHKRFPWQPRGHPRPPRRGQEKGHAPTGENKHQNHDAHADEKSSTRTERNGPETKIPEGGGSRRGGQKH